MLPWAETAARSVPLLTVHCAGRTWGIPSSAVTSIERPAAGVSDGALDLLELLGISEPAQATPTHAARVLVLQVHGERLLLLVHGALTLASAAARELLPLPSALQRSAPLLSHLGVLDGEPALLVLSPERLLQAARGKRPSLLPHDPARGSSC